MSSIRDREALPKRFSCRIHSRLVWTSKFLSQLSRSSLVSGRRAPALMILLEYLLPRKVFANRYSLTKSGPHTQVAILCYCTLQTLRNTKQLLRDQMWLRDGIIQPLGEGVTILEWGRA